MASIEIHDNVGQVKCRQRIGNAVAISSGTVLTSGEVDVRDQIGKRVGLDDEGEGGVGVRLEDRGDCLSSF